MNWGFLHTVTMAKNGNCPGQVSELTEEIQLATAVSSEGWAVLPAVTQDTSRRALSPAKANLKSWSFECQNAHLL